MSKTINTVEYIHYKPYTKGSTPASRLSVKSMDLEYSLGQFVESDESEFIDFLKETFKKELNVEDVNILNTGISYFVLPSLEKGIFNVCIDINGQNVVIFDDLYVILNRSFTNLSDPKLGEPILKNVLNFFVERDNFFNYFGFYDEFAGKEVTVEDVAEGINKHLEGKLKKEKEDLTDIEDTTVLVFRDNHSHEVITLEAETFKKYDMEVPKVIEEVFIDWINSTKGKIQLIPHYELTSRFVSDERFNNVVFLVNFDLSKSKYNFALASYPIFGDLLVFKLNPIGSRFESLSDEVIEELVSVVNEQIDIEEREGYRKSMLDQIEKAGGNENFIKGMVDYLVNKENGHVCGEDCNHDHH